MLIRNVIEVVPMNSATALTTVQHLYISFSLHLEYQIQLCLIMAHSLLLNNSKNFVSQMVSNTFEWHCAIHYQMVWQNMLCKFLIKA